MIRRLTGTIVDTGVAHVVIDVGGVGYLVRTTTSGLSYQLESMASFWTYLAVRETALDLYGFVTRDELELFELLLTLPKIGPKSAAQILGQADITLLKQAVIQEDATYLSKMSGIGKKSAEKIVLGLKGKIDAWQETDGGEAAIPNASFQTEAIDALITLGYPQKDARETIQALPPEITTTTAAITAALRQLGSE